MSQCEFISFQASHFSSNFRLDDHYGSGGGGYLQGGSPFSASGSPGGGGRVSRVQRH